MESRQIRVRYYSQVEQSIKTVEHDIVSLGLWKIYGNCIDIMDCETGEMLYIKG